VVLVRGSRERGYGLLQAENGEAVTASCTSSATASQSRPTERHPAGATARHCHWSCHMADPSQTRSLRLLAAHLRPRPAALPLLHGHNNRSDSRIWANGTQHTVGSCACLPRCLHPSTTPAHHSLRPSPAMQPCSGESR
jgi:hypothetical protein